MKRMTMREAIIATLEEEMQRDAHVFVMGEDVGRYGGGFGATQGLQKRFGESRVMDMPISEGAFMNMAVGAAMVGTVLVGQVWDQARGARKRAMVQAPPAVGFVSRRPPPCFSHRA